MEPYCPHQEAFSSFSTNPLTMLTEHSAHVYVTFDQWPFEDASSELSE